MLKVTSTLKGLLALALGSFALGASAALPELSTDAAPKYYFIKNLRADQYVDADGGLVGEMRHSAVTTTSSLYEPGSTLWYFVSAGEKKTVAFADGSSHEVTPVYIKNLTRPGKTYNVFGKVLFNETGRPYYLFEHTHSNNTGFVIMRTKDNVAYDNNGLGMNDEALCWSDFGGSGSNQIAAYKANDGGSIFDFVAADASLIDMTRTNYLTGVKKQLRHTVSLVDKVMGSETSAISADILSSIENLTLETAENVTASIMTTVTPLLNRKVVYMVSNGRKAANKNSYIYLDPATGKSKASDHKCVRGKWQLVLSGSGNSFHMRNISTDCYWSANSGNKATAATERRTNQFNFAFVPHKDGEGFVLKYTGNNMCMYINNGDEDFVDFNDAVDPSNVYDTKYSFSFEPANINEPELEAAVSDDDATNDYFVIRSRLGKYEEDSYYFNENVKYPGSLVTAYPADRELARKRAGNGYHNGAHLEMYSPGSVWKFVKDGEGWKIYSLIGEQKEGGNKGLKVVDYDGTEYVDVAAEPTTFYLKAITASADEFATPDTYALCTAKEGGKYVTVSDTNDHGDFFLTLSTTAPTTNAQDPAAFLIESIGSTHDGVDPVAEYVKYAAELHMFKSIAPVLNEEDMTYILAEKKGYDYENINSIAAANEFMGLGDMTASSRAFQRLDGKMIRLQNRVSPYVVTKVNAWSTTPNPGARYLYSNSEYDGNPLANIKGMPANPLASIWAVELPGETEQEKIEAARMRQLRLRNLATGDYVLSNLKTGAAESAQTLTVRRRVSLDQSEFFLALTKDYERNTALMMLDSGDNYILESAETRWGANSSIYAHWIVETAAPVAAAPTVTLAKDLETDKYILTVAAPDGATMTPTGITWIGNATIEETPAANGVAALALDGATDVTLTETSGNYTAAFEGLGSTETDKHYTVKLPAGMFAIGNNVSPAVTANLTLAKETSTGIKEVNAAEKGVEVIYDLQGRRVSKAGKGVYIINGVKTLVK